MLMLFTNLCRMPIVPLLREAVQECYMVQEQFYFRMNMARWGLVLWSNNHMHYCISLGFGFFVAANIQAVVTKLIHCVSTAP